MSSRTLLSTLCFFALVSLARAGDSPEEILRKAIKARGGADKSIEFLGKVDDREFKKP